MEKHITIRALKYGDKPHYEWETLLLAESNEHMFVLGEYGRKLNHYTKQKEFTMEAWTIEFFSFVSWFTVSANIVDGQIEQYYCNINQPATLQGSTVSFVDLDLDYVQRKGEWLVVDEDEFASNAVQFGYPEELIKRARQELESLKERVRDHLFPFDGTIETFISRIPKGNSGR